MVMSGMKMPSQLRGMHSYISEAQHQEAEATTLIKRMTVREGSGRDIPVLHIELVGAVPLACGAVGRAIRCRTWITMRSAGGLADITQLASRCATPSKLHQVAW